jgi:hypothetical protein
VNGLLDFRRQKGEYEIKQPKSWRKMRQLFGSSELATSPNAVPATIISSTGPSVMGSIDPAGEGGLDTVKEEDPHRPKKLDFVGGGVTVGVDAPVDTDCRLGVDALRDGAGLCAGVL